MKNDLLSRRKKAWKCCYLISISLFFGVFAQSDLHAFTLNVVDRNGSPIVGGFRYLVEEDSTHLNTPGVPSGDGNRVLSLGIARTSATVVANGREAGSSAVINVPSSKRYAVSVLPNTATYTVSGTNVAIGQSTVTVTLNALPIPTAQISVLIFNDKDPINSAPDIPGEEGLPNFSILVLDQLGQVSQDAFGNPLGTTYQLDANGNPVIGPDGGPVVQIMGNGVILTGADGMAFVKYLAPGKYGIRAVPPPGTNWIQTSTIEGTPGIDAWVKSNEPPFLVEFGPRFPHIFIGFVDKSFNLLTGAGTTITGQVVRFHSARPPVILPQNGVPVSECWVGLNDTTLAANKGLQVKQCNPNIPGQFTFENVPPGTYQIVIWDTPLDYIFGFYTVIVPDPPTPQNVGQLGVNAWFGNFEGSVFNDANENAFRDPGEAGISNQVINLRHRDGSIYQTTVTMADGSYEFKEVFPFFKWIVAEVDGSRFKATGATVFVDNGAQAADPAGTKITPQPQPENNNLGWRTELGGVFTEPMMLFADQTNIMDWGKKNYGPGENGGIAGVIYYATTRAEDDANLATADAWEPAIPRVQVNLYRSDGQGHIISPQGGVGVLADVDNYPYGNFPGPEDIDWNGNRIFDSGSAVMIAYTDSWDDSMPTGCVYTDPAIQRPTFHGVQLMDCAESLRTWNQLRPGVYDGAYIFTSYFPNGIPAGTLPSRIDETTPGQAALPSGVYIVQAVMPPGYQVQKEEDKNVVFGESYKPSKALNPPPCVGDPHTVPPYLALFTDQQIPSVFSGQVRPLCDRKEVLLPDGQNGAADFFFFTEVPRSARGIGLVTNDIANTLAANDPNFGEKLAPSWIPISFQDFAGKELVRVYTDEYGSYNALVPSTYTVNPPIPTGVSPNMLSICLNHPGPIPNPNSPGQFITDPYFNPHYQGICYNLDFWPGKITYLDTPVIPIAAFTGATNTNLDCEFPNGTPIISYVNGPEGGPYVAAPGASITIVSAGSVSVPNTNYPNGPATVMRNFGFGSVPGRVTIGGVELQNIQWATDGLSIRATVPAGSLTGELVVTRGDNGKSTLMGVTLNVGNEGRQVIKVSPGQSIQQAINSALQPGTLILVAPGSYNENPIMWKNVRLQGYGAASTIIEASPFPQERITAWETLRNNLLTQGSVNLLPGQTVNDLSGAPGITVLGVSPANLNQTFAFSNNPRARIDGFTIRGAQNGGGILVNGYAPYVEISNNRIISNQGNVGGGIRIGTPSLVDTNCGGTGTGYCSSQTNNISLHNNHITQNGGYNAGGVATSYAGGGVGIYNGSSNYQLTENYICGNFTNISGSGVAHVGLSDNAVIADNIILFNEAFYGSPLGGDGGGILITGETVPAGAPAGTLSQGTGSVLVNTNIIQGNLAGSGNGGGIRTAFVNGQDAQAAPGNSATWYTIKVFNNQIVDNVAAIGGGGLAVQDTAKIYIINNTIANNDSTATGANAFVANPNISTPQGAGIVATEHSLGLANSIGVLENNIIYRNRSFRWNSTLNDGLGGIEPNPARTYWDLQVTAISNPNFMSPTYSILTDVTGTAPTNRAVDPKFVSGYFNSLQWAVAAQEGGNFVNVTYTPLTPWGDYHIRPVSPAVTGGSITYLAQFAELNFDYDRQARPNGSAIGVGADENYATLFAALGVKRGATWYLDLNRNAEWDGCGTDGCLPSFGLATDIPVSGDWTGSGTMKIGVFRNGQWYLDMDSNSAWDGCNTDACYTSFGFGTDVPVTGDWGGTGRSKIGVFRNGQWFLDLNGNGAWDGCATDGCVASFGQAGDVPVAGDWSGTGTTKVGVFRPSNGQWFLDLNGNGAWDGCGPDACYASFGTAGDIPITGDWNGSGITRIGVFRNGQWFLDLNGNGALDGCGTDACYTYGAPGDVPVAVRLR
jgi:large repetitive protein